MEVKPQNDEKLVVKYGGIPGSEFEDLNMSGSSFKQVALAEAKFDHVNMVHASFEDVNLSNISMHSVTMGGAKFTIIGGRLTQSASSSVGPAIPRMGT